MSKFSDAAVALEGLQYMSHEKAEFMRNFILEHDISSILEVGFFKGKSTAYFAAILEDADRGHITTLDRRGAKKHKPNIFQLLTQLELAHRATPIFADRSHTWELAKLISMKPRPQFDFCFFDGGHTWDVTGFGFTLVDLLLRPGGWIIFDDLDWTIERSLRSSPHRKDMYAAYGVDERRAAGVRMVFELLVRERGYISMEEIAEFGWGVARKPE